MKLETERLILREWELSDIDDLVEELKRKSFLCIADNTYKDEYIVGLLKEEWKK